MSKQRRFLLVQVLTLIRGPLIFLFLLITVATPHPLSAGMFALAFGALLLAAITDVLDGWLARRLGVTSRLGSYADPLLDKVFYLTAFPVLVYLAAAAGQGAHARSLLVLAILFLLRDQWVSFLRSIGALHNLDAKANWSGKARTIISFPTVCVIYFFLQSPADWAWRVPAGLVYALEGLSMAINLVSIVVYTACFWPALRSELRAPNPPTGAGK